jgi:hypothetical protein
MDFRIMDIDRPSCYSQICLPIIEWISVDVIYDLATLSIHNEPVKRARSGHAHNISIMPFVFSDSLDVISVYDGFFEWPFSLIIKGDVGHITICPDTGFVVSGSVKDVAIAIQLLPMSVTIPLSVDLATTTGYRTRFHAYI